ncbi:MAG: hypothetical protein LUH58_01215, partial [Lachnospiraceae bacterium]|nr:hypothetical protein [Lachnospiraceae bacterium]
MRRKWKQKLAMFMALCMLVSSFLPTGGQTIYASSVDDISVEEVGQETGLETEEAAENNDEAALTLTEATVIDTEEAVVVKEEVGETATEEAVSEIEAEIPEEGTVAETEEEISEEEAVETEGETAEEAVLEAEEELPGEIVAGAEEESSEGAAVGAEEETSEEIVTEAEEEAAGDATVNDETAEAGNIGTSDEETSPEGGESVTEDTEPNSDTLEKETVAGTETEAAGETVTEGEISEVSEDDTSSENVTDESGKTEVTESQAGTLLTTVGEEETGEVTLESIEVVTDPITTFYYGIDDGLIYLGDAVFSYTFSDGSSTQCTAWDDTWYEIWDTYGIYYACSADGNIDYDDAGYQPVGNYEFVIYADGVEYLSIPYSVISPDDIELELVDGSGVYELTGNEGYNKYYIKMAVEPGKLYTLTSTSDGDYKIWTNEYETVVDFYGTFWTFTAEETGYYYLHAYVYGDFDLTLTSVDLPVSVEIVTEPRTIYYYGLDEGYKSLDGATFLLTFEDGTSMECSPWDDTWNEYSLYYYESRATDGNYITYDDMGYQPVGEYQFVISCNGVECAVIPYKVLALDEIEFDLAEGFGLYGLTGSEDSNGYFIRMSVEAGRSYTLSSTAYGNYRILTDEYECVVNFYGSSWTFTTMTSGCYYLWVSVPEDFDLTLTSVNLPVSVDTVSEPRTIYYYGIDEGYIYPYNAEFLLTFEDGTSVECSLGDETWCEYGMNYEYRTPDGDYITYDDMGCQPAGEYYFMIYAGENACVTIPYTVKALEDIDLELKEGDTLSGLSGDGDDYGWWAEGQYVKLQVEEGLTYKVTSSCSYGLLELWDQECNTVSSVWSSGIVFTAEYGGIYYLRISSRDDFDLIMESVPVLTSVEVLNLFRTVYYYAIGQGDISMDGATFRLTFEDGSTIDCSLFDDTWIEYGMTYGVRTADGGYITRDENGYQPEGEYQFVVYVSDTAYTSVPITIVSLDNISLEMGEGETLSGLAGDGSDYGWSADGNYLKLLVEEGQTYRVTSSSYGLFRLWNNVYSEVSSEWCYDFYFTAEYDGTYYLKISCEDDFDLTLTSVNLPVSVDVVTEPRAVYYYGIDEGYICPYDAEYLFNFSDGSGMTHTFYTSSEYEISYASQTADGGGIAYDENGYQPIGSYQFVVYIDKIEYVTIPYSVVSADEISLELEEDGTLFGLSGDGLEYGWGANGNYLKLQVEEGKTYRVTSSSYGLFRLWNDGYSEVSSEWCSSFCFTAEYGGTYYLKISCEDDFDLALTTVDLPVSVEVVSEQGYVFYYGLDQGYISPDDAVFLLTFEDGTSVECSIWDNTWYEYDMSYGNMMANGDYITYDDMGYQPAGEYQFVIYVSESAYATIPYTVLSPDDISLEIGEGDTLTGLSGDGSDYGWGADGNYLKLQVEEGQTYKLTSSSYSLFVLWDEECGEVDYEWGYKQNFTADYTGTYYLKISCENDFDLSMILIPTVESVEVVYDSELTYYYALDENYIYPYAADFLVTFTDGSSVECTVADDIWEEYNLAFSSVTAEGEDISYDSLGYQPVGDYSFVISCNGVEYATIPYTVLSLDNVSLEMNEGEKLTDLAGGASPKWYVVGNYIKLQVEEGKVYELISSSYGLFRLVDKENNIISAWDTNFTFTADYTGIYYLKLSCRSDYSLSMMLKLNVENVEILTYPQTEYCYALNSYVSLTGAEFLLTLEDGTSIECTPWSSTANIYDLTFESRMADGSSITRDDKGYLPVGEYEFVIYIGGEERTVIPYTIMSLDEIELELAENSNLTGLTGNTDSNGYYIKMAVEAGKSYTVSSSVDGNYRIWTNEYESVVDLYGTSWTFAAETTGYYYLWASASENFDLMLTSVDLPVSVDVVTEPRTVYYYGLDDGDIFPAYAEFQFNFSDGSSITHSISSSDEYSISWTNLTVDGNGITYDENGYQPIGDYRFDIYINGVEYDVTIPYSIVSADEISLELAENGTFSDLSGDGLNYGWSADGNYLKLQVEEGVTYKVATTSYGLFRLWDQEYSSINSSWTSNFTFTADYTGIYYLKVSCYNDFDLSMTSILGVSSVEILESPRTTYYYGLDQGYIYPMNATFRLTFEDGTSVDCTLWDNTWYDYGMSYESLTADGDYITYDGTGYQPVGEYQFVIYVNGTAYASIPYAVLSPDEISLEMGEGDTLPSLSGEGSDYGWSAEGHYIRLNVEQGKVYKVAASSYGTLRVWDESYNQVSNVVSTSDGRSYTYFTAEYTGVYYLKASCYDDFDLTLSASAGLISIEITEYPASTLYYGVDYYFYGARSVTLRLYLEDGTSVDCTMYDDNWYMYGLSYKTVTADGDSWSYDSSGKQPMGDYLYEFYTDDCSVTAPYSVVSLEEAPVLSSGEIISWESGIPSAYQFVVEEDGTYLISVDAGSYVYFRTYDSDQSRIASVYCQNKEWAVELTAGTYYFYIFNTYFPNSVTFSVTRLAELSEMSYDGGAITFSYGAWGYSAGATVSGN